MNNRFKKIVGIFLCGILFECVILMWYKQFSYLNYGSISPTYVPPEAQQEDIDLETSEIPVVDGGYILELSYECAVETNWQLADADGVTLCQGVLNPGETTLRESFEIAGADVSGDNREASESVRLTIEYAKEGYLSVQSFRLYRGTDPVLTLRGKDFHCTYLGFQDGEIKEYYNYLGRQEFYGLNPYQQITVYNNTPDVLYFDLNNCEDYENIENIVSAEKLEAGESWQFRFNDRISYQAALYSPTAELEEISVTVNNIAYMNEYKTAVVVMLCIVAFLTAAVCIAVLAGVPKSVKKYWNIAAVLLHLLGIFFHIIRIEPYTVNIFLLIPVFMMAAALLFNERDRAAKYCREYNGIYAGIITFLLSVGMYVAVLNSREGSFLSYLSPMNGKGLLLYVMFVIASVLLFMIVANILERHNAVLKRVNQYLNCKESLLLGIMLGNFIFKDHVGAELSLDWRRWQLYLVLAMLAAITLCLYRPKTDTKQNEWALRALYLLEIFSVQVNKTLINIYGADSLTFGETHHISAYYDEITYLAKGEPFRGGGTELYGHYGVLWRLPMTVFGNNLKVVGIVAGIVAAVTFFFFILTVQRLFCTRFVKIMASLSLWCMFISSSSSTFSSIPHRYVFFSVILYLMVRWQTRDLSLRRRLTGHLLCVMALFWNTESGLCVSLAWAVYIVVREIKNRDNCFWPALRKLLIQAAIVGMEIILFFGSVEFYNRFFCGGKVNQTEISVQDKEQDKETEMLAQDKGIQVTGPNKSVQREPEESETDLPEREEEQEDTSQGDLEDFISKNTGVLFDSGFMGNNMNGKYRFENQPLFSAMIFVLLVSFYFLSGLGIFGKSNQKEYAASALAICVFGLMLFSYSASRDFGDISKGGIPFLIVFFLIFEKAMLYIKMHPKEYTLKNNIVYLLGLFMLVGLVQMELNSFLALERFHKLLNEKNILDYNSMQRDMEQFADSVPEGTYAYGNGIAEIYMSIGREIPDSSDAQYFITDAWRDVDDLPYVKIRDVQVGRYIYTLYYHQGYGE